MDTCYTDGSATNAVQKGGAGMITQFPNKRQQAKYFQLDFTAPITELRFWPWFMLQTPLKKKQNPTVKLSSSQMPNQFWKLSVSTNSLSFKMHFKTSRAPDWFCSGSPFTVVSGEMKKLTGQTWGRQRADGLLRQFLRDEHHHQISVPNVPNF